MKQSADAYERHDRDTERRHHGSRTGKNLRRCLSSRSSPFAGCVSNNTFNFGRAPSRSLGFHLTADQSPLPLTTPRRPLEELSTAHEGTVPEILQGFDREIRRMRNCVGNVDHPAGAFAFPFPRVRPLLPPESALPLLDPCLTSISNSQKPQDRIHSIARLHLFPVLGVLAESHAVMFSARRGPQVVSSSQTERR